jgi:hypothetical protein
MCRQTRGRTPVQPGDARVRSHERSAAQPERWLRRGYRLDAPAGIADGFGDAWAFQSVALAPRFSVSLLGLAGNVQSAGGGYRAYRRHGASPVLSIPGTSSFLDGS